MALSPTHHTAGSDAGNVTSVVTASITPTGNSLVVAVHRSRTGTGAPNIPTVTGCSLTWVQVVTTVAFTNFRVTCFRALKASPTAGMVTFDYAGQSNTENAWTLFEVSGVDTGGTDGSTAVVQAVSDITGGATSMTLTLGAFHSGTNGTFGGFIQNAANSTFTAGAGFTAIGNNPTGDQSMFSEWRADNNTTVGVTSTLVGSWFGAALELAPPIPPSIPGGQVIARVQSMGRIATRPQSIVM